MKFNQNLQALRLKKELKIKEVRVIIKKSCQRKIFNDQFILN